MCSINDDIIINTKNHLRQLTEGTPCKKCDERAELILRAKDPICKNCFIEYCTHKFKSTIGKSKVMKPGDKVLVAYSGNLTSSALAHMLHKRNNDKTRKKFIFSVGLIYIDEALKVNKTDDERLEICRNACELVNHLDFPIYISTLETMFKSDDEELAVPINNLESSNIFCNEIYKNEFLNSIKSFISNSALEEYIKYSRYNFLTRVAASLGYNKVFIADCANSLAVTLLSGIAQGQGSHIYSEIGFMDDRYKVPVIRPLREFLYHEIERYCQMLKIPYLRIQATSINSKCIGTITEEFVNSLHEEYPATINTIVRTGDKLTTAVQTSEVKSCSFCKSPLDTLSKEPCTALNALRFTQQMCKSTKERTKEDQRLCYSCNTLNRESKSSQVLYPGHHITDVLKEYLI